MGLLVRQIRNCADHVQQKNTPASQIKTLLYDTTTTTEEVSLTGSIYDIYDESDCGLTTCSLMTSAGSCTTAYTPTADNEITTTGNVPADT
jgi:hypothetical protein